MNRSRAAEANKHTLDVCTALIARGGLVKHVVHRGNSFLYVSLPAVFDLYMQRHGVFIPSFTAYARTLSSDLVLHDRTHTQRFPPHYHKAAAVTFRWPADRVELPAADELAELLHLNEQPPVEAVSGTESGKITWGTRIQAKPRAVYQQQQQQAVAGVGAGGSAVGAAAVDGATILAANGHVETNGHIAPTAAVSHALVPGSDVAADQQAKLEQQDSGRPGSTSSSSNSLLEGRQQQQREQAPSAAAAAAVPSAAAASGGTAVVQESPFIGKRGRDDTPEQQQHEEQQPAKQLRQASNSPGQVANMLTFPLSSVAVVTQQQQQQQLQQQQSPSPTQEVKVLRQHTPKQQQQPLGPGSHLVNQQTPKRQQQQQALGPGSHLVNQQTPKRQQQQQALGPGSHLVTQHTPKQKQQQQALGPGSHLLSQQKLERPQQQQLETQPIPKQPLPPGMQVQKLQKLQQPPSWLPYQLPPQQQQQQPRLPPSPASRPVVKRLPAGMRVGSMSHQERLQLLTWLLKGRPERLQQLKLQQQGAAAADAEGGPSRTQHGGAGNSANPQQQQQQALSASQVQMLQASLRKRQHELSQQQQASALRNGLAAAGFAGVKSEADAAAAGRAGSMQQQQQQEEEDAGVQRGSTREAQQEVEQLQQELQQLQSLLLNQGQAQHDQQQQQLLEQSTAAMQQESRKRKTPEAAAQQQQQERLPHSNRLQQGAGSGHRLSSGPLSPLMLTAAEQAEVQALLTAMCVVSGAADVQQLVAGIDIQLRSSCSKGQQQGAGSSAAGVTSEQQQQEQQEASDMDREVLRELRCLALAFGQQGLRVPSLRDLTQDVPCLLEGVAALDGQQLLCLSETQLQGFLAAVECSELQRAVHAAQHAAQRHNHHQQQQQESSVKARASRDAAAAAVGLSGSSIAQLQQELAAELMSAYRSASGGVVVRPHSLMMLTGQRLMAAAQQVPQLSPLQQTPLAAAVAGCLAEREAQLLQSREQGAAVTGLHLLNAFMLRRKFDRKLAGQRQLVLDMPAQCTVLAAASGSTSQMHLSTVSAAVFAFPLLQEQQMLTAEAEEASGAVLSSWLFVAPQLYQWQRLVCGLKQIRRQQQVDHKQQQQQQEAGDARDPRSLQECRVQAEKLLHELRLQPQDLAWLQRQLRSAPDESSVAVKEQSSPQADASGKSKQQQVAVLLQQEAGQAVLTKPGWMHLVVNHAAGVKVCMEFVVPADVAACAVAQHELQQGSSSGGEELASLQLGPVVLTVLQQWCAYCRQQELQLQQQ